MPELPEVETICRDLNAALLNQTIERVEVLDPRVIRLLSQDGLKNALTANTFKKIFRRGKALIFELGQGPYTLVVQPMMTGQLIVSQQRAYPPACRIALIFLNGQRLYYNDQRVFGRWQLVQNLNEINHVRTMGPEPLARSFTQRLLSEKLKKHHRPIKPLLMEPSFIAGIGNIYASEILFEAQIDPRRPADSLNAQEAGRLFHSIQSVLREAVRLRGSSVNTYVDGKGEKGTFMTRIRVYQQDGKPCSQCGGEIQKIVQAQRSTFMCLNCQQ